MYTLKSFMSRYGRHITEDQVLGFVQNTGNTLDILAATIDHALSQGMTVKEAFSGRHKALFTLKAGGDVFATYGQQIADAARAAAQRPGADGQAIEAQLQQWLESLQALAATKSAAPLSFIQQAAIASCPELYGLQVKGKPNR